MSGHSKWSTIKRKKAAIDSKRGKIFSKLNKEITVSAKEGGGDPDTNPRLRVAIQKAKDCNMPSDNVKKAIKKGTGEIPGVCYEEITYEGYAKGGVAILIEVLTDNKNRTAPEIRSIFAKKEGNLANPGAVAWMFEKKGIINIKKESLDEDSLLALILDNGGEDLNSEEEIYEVTTSPENFETVKTALTQNNIPLELAEITFTPKNTLKITDIHTAQKVLNLIDDLEENDDVQNVYANFDIPDELLSQIE